MEVEKVRFIKKTRKRAHAPKEMIAPQAKVKKPSLEEKPKEVKVRRRKGAPRAPKPRKQKETSFDKEEKALEKKIKEEANQPVEIELWKDTREGLIQKAKKLGIHQPYRMTKLALISAITDRSEDKISKDLEKHRKIEEKKEMKEAEKETDKENEDLIDRGINRQIDHMKSIFGPQWVLQEEDRLGETMSKQEQDQFIEEKLDELYRKRVHKRLTKKEKEMFADIGRGMTWQDIDKKYPDPIEIKEPLSPTSTIYTVGEVTPSMRRAPRAEPKYECPVCHQKLVRKSAYDSHLDNTTTSQKHLAALQKAYQNIRRVDQSTSTNPPKEIEIQTEDSQPISEEDLRGPPPDDDDKQPPKSPDYPLAEIIFEDELTGNRKSDSSLTKVDNSDALSNRQIDKIMEPYADKYLGCVCCDTIDRDIYPLIRPKSKGGFIINTDKEIGKGEHWVSVFFDARPGSSESLCFFDSEGQEPDPIIDASLKRIAEKLGAGTYLKYKINSVKQQGKKDGTDKLSSNCGWFATKFLIDMFRGKSFPEATGYDASKMGEKNIEKFKQKEKKEKIGFGYLPSFGNIKKFFTPSRELSNHFKNILNKYGNLRILNADIRRAPISGFIDKALNLLSLGTFHQFKKEMGYDSMFHLGIVLNLENGKKLLLEKNAKPEFSETYKDDKDTKYYPLRIDGSPTLKEFIDKTIKLYGDYAFTNYDAFNNNCQKFIIMLLTANRSLTPPIKTFIYQDVSNILKTVPSYVDKISRGATDIAAVAGEFIGKRKFTTKRKKELKKIFKYFSQKPL